MCRSLDVIKLLSLSCVCFALACQPEDPSADDNKGDGSDQGQDVIQDMDTSASDDGGTEPVQEEMTLVLNPGVDVSVATFNVQRLFDEECDSGQCDADDFEEVISTLSINSKVDRIQRALMSIDADVIVLQEIEKKELLDRVLEGMESEYPTAIFGETNFAASLDVAVISRGDYIKHVKHRGTVLQTQTGGTEKFAREFLEVHVEIEGQEVIVFGAHFISKRTSNSAPRRWAEGNGAGEIASKVAAENPEALVVIAGDLNDTPDSAPLTAMCSHGCEMPSLKVSADKYYTHVFYGERAILDHVVYWPAEHVQMHPDGLSVIRDTGKDGLADSDHASPRVLFRLAD